MDIVRRPKSLALGFLQWPQITATAVSIALLLSIKAGLFYEPFSPAAPQYLPLQYLELNCGFENYFKGQDSCMGDCLNGGQSASDLTWDRLPFTCEQNRINNGNELHNDNVDAKAIQKLRRTLTF